MVRISKREYSELMDAITGALASSSMPACPKCGERGTTGPKGKWRCTHCNSVASKTRIEGTNRTQELTRAEKLCPNGCGLLRDWKGHARCWTCGWPEKNKNLGLFRYIFRIIIAGLLIFGGVKLYDEVGWEIVIIVAFIIVVFLAIGIGGTGGVRGVVGVTRNIDDDDDDVGGFE